MTGAVWIVDDSPLEAEMARRVLAPAFDVELFTDGTTMLERLSNKGSPDLLILDWQLPSMSGIEVCRFVRGSLDEVLLPILMLTVQGHKPDIVEGLSAGANDYVTKPYDAAELKARATSLCRMRRLNLQASAAHQEREVLLSRAQEAFQRADEANRAKDDFLATVSHELRTPLNAIVGWITLLKNGKLPAERQQHALETIARNARAQTQLIDDLLDVSRIISGKLRLSLEPTDICQVVRAAVEALGPTADAKKVRVTCEIPDPDCLVMGDATRLQQVIWNLLANAVKFTQAGGSVVVQVRGDGSGVALTVIDDGQGIAPEVLPDIFERFSQAETTFSRSHGGLGLGLAIVKHLVDLHGGSVRAHSDGLGTGATFVVLLPSLDVRPDPRSSRRSSSIATVTPDRLSGLRVLLVDDDDDGREVVAAILRAHGAEVDIAASAREALAILDRAVPDILVSDIGMPEEDGLSLLRRVRARSTAAGGRVPAVALTAYARAEDRTKSLMAGFNTHVTKPVEGAELVMALANLTGRFDHDSLRP